MRYLILILFFNTLCLSIFGQGEWQYFTPTEADFTVLLPQVPTIKNKDLHTELGVLTSTNYHVNTKGSKNFLYSINVVNYEDGTFHKDSTNYNQETLRQSIDQISRLLKCEIVYANIQDQNDLPSYIFRLADTTSGQVVKGKVFLQNDSVYTLTVFTTQEHSLNEDMDKFLTSFKFLSP